MSSENQHNEDAPLLSHSRDDASTLGPASSSASITQTHQSARKQEIIRYVSFASAVLMSLCAGSLTAYSLYGHIFQERLAYSQYQVNMVIVAAEISMYLPVPIFGYLCDRYGPAPLSCLAACLFGGGYLLAAFTYRAAADLGEMVQGQSWPFTTMVVAFIAIGIATVCMYVSAVATCAKNFSKSKFKGLALACPIASFGLSGMWQSQVGSRLLYEHRPDGSRGDVDVFKFFIFLAIVVFVVGIIGTFTLKVVDEEDMIDNAIDELEQSGLLDDNDVFRRGRNGHNYGTAGEDPMMGSTQSLDDMAKARLAEEQRKKNMLLNEETRRFLRDPTMWWLAAGFFLVSGPGDTFINNLGTIIGTLYPRTKDALTIPTSAATHVSIVAITSTVARLLSGTVTDVLAPAGAVHHFRQSTSNSLASLPLPSKAFTVSRVVFLVAFAIMFSIGQVVLASGVIQRHGERFWIVSTLIGSGYGAVFSLTPIIVAVIWGAENFGTNWGIVAVVPAFGAIVWGIVYSSVYQWAAARSSALDAGRTKDVFCYGKDCYSATFWAMAVSSWVACIMFLWAWKGKGGWSQRGIVV